MAGNVLTRGTVAVIRECIVKKHAESAYLLTIYAEESHLTASTLEKERITPKQIPYHVKARR
jgi:hypothetical protein